MAKPDRYDNISGMTDMIELETPVATEEGANEMIQVLFDKRLIASTRWCNYDSEKKMLGVRTQEVFLKDCEKLFKLGR